MSSTVVTAPRAAASVRHDRGLVLTPRGRVVVRVLAWLTTTAVAALAVLLVWVAAASFVAPGASAGDGAGGVVSGAGLGAVVSEDELGAVAVTVEAGDTLWSLARAHAPERDPRAVVHDLVRLNGLPSSTVAVGERLLVPTR
jgi:nucleoid-associated protein YgaU